LSEITEGSGTTLADISVNLIDFDTKLTRYDIYRISRKNDYWQMRIREVNSIQDQDNRKTEKENLVAEMMRDPSTNKIVRQFRGLGRGVTLRFLQVLVMARMEPR